MSGQLETQALQTAAARALEEPPEYLTPAQVAELLQVSLKSVFRWAGQDRTMPALRLGRTVRFPRERVMAWLRAREQGRGRPRLVAKDGPA